jgi:hypothetical protein
MSYLFYPIGPTFHGHVDRKTTSVITRQYVLYELDRSLMAAITEGL